MELKVFGKQIETPLHPIGTAFEHIELIFHIPRYYEGMDLSCGTVYMIAVKDGSTQQYYLEKADYEQEILAKWDGMFESSGAVSILLKISSMEAEIYKSYPITVRISDPVRSTFSLRSAAVPSSISSRIAVMDEEEPITISERTIIVPPELQNIAVQNDENSEEVFIVIPRYFDGNDLDPYTAILKTVSRGGRDDLPLTKVTTSDTELTFSWTLAPPQTSYSGELKLQIRFVGDGFKWETDTTSVNIIASQDAKPVVPNTPAIIDGLIDQVNSYAGQAQQSASESYQNASDAALSAESALIASESAQKSASAAAGSASAAAGSADRAEAAANRAEQIVGGDFATKAELSAGLAGKVDAESGKGLSSNDYTDAEKQKLAGIEAGANNYSHPATHPASMITGLGDAATKNVGTAAGTVAAGNHYHAGVYDLAGSAGAVQKNLNAHEGDGSIHRSITWQTVILTSSGWSSSQQTVSVTGITASGSGLIKPAPVAGDSYTAYTEAGIKALPIATDGQLIFQCESVPSVNISVVVEVVS